MITSSKIKFINTLKLKKHRIENGLFIAEGTKVVNDLIINNYDITELYATTAFIENHITVLSDKNILVHEVSEKELNRISALTTPNQVLAVCKMKDHEIDIKEILNRWSFVLDEINDPGNLGTIIRIAHWFNIKYIICSPGTVDVYNPKTVQSTMGSLAFVKIVYTDLPSFLKKLDNKIPILGAFMNGKNIYDVNLGKSGIVIFGSESHGISNEVRKSVSISVSIPSANKASCPDSLNVAVSTGIIAAELLRKGLLK